MAVFPLRMARLSKACERLHGKLIRSYAVEALVRRGNEFQEVSEPVDKRSHRLRGETVELVGYGTDCRTGGGTMVSIVLVWREIPIHCASFRAEDDDEEENEERMVGFENRRQFRA